MPTLSEARAKVRELSHKQLEIVQDGKLTPAEQREAIEKSQPDLDHWMGEVRDLEFVDQRRKELIGSSSGHSASEAAPVNASGTLGQQFVQSAGYKALMARGLSGSKWSSGDVELHTKAEPPDPSGVPLAEGTGAAPGGGNALVALPTVQPGIVDTRFQELVVADLFPSSATSTPLIRYIVESVATNRAASVAEGGLKPPSEIAFDTQDETLHKIATFLPITDEMLSDFGQIQGYIDGRLRLFIQLEEQHQLLNGEGSNGDLIGMLNVQGLGTTVVIGSAPSAADDNAMDAVFRQITALRTTAFLEPDAVVIDPVSWANILVSKNEQGAYYANGPFVGTQPNTLWGKRVVITPEMTANTALVGSFSQGAMLFRKGGITVEASNSHVDFFQRNLTALRAEERMGLAVYRPGAFGLVTLTPAGTGG